MSSPSKHFNSGFKCLHNARTLPVWARLSSILSGITLGPAFASRQLAASGDAASEYSLATYRELRRRLIISKAESTLLRYIADSHLLPNALVTLTICLQNDVSLQKINRNRNFIANAVYVFHTRKNIIKMLIICI